MDSVVQYATSVHYALREVESQFDDVKITLWMKKYWTLSFLFSAIYLLLIYVGRQWMEKRKPYDLRKALSIWSFLLSTFSIFCLFRCSYLIYTQYKQGGFEHTTCDLKFYKGVHAMGLWSFLFAFSKLPELLDTAFIVLRKTKLPFLHYYHHVTVFIYCWYSYAFPVGPGIWFGSINFFVHSIMYMYYAITATGRRFPRTVSKCITIVQLSQMFVGIYVNFVSVRAWLSGRFCGGIDWIAVAISVFFYISYAILFANFFYNAYIVKKPAKESKNAPQTTPEITKVTDNELRNGKLTLLNGKSNYNGIVRHR